MFSSFLSIAIALLSPQIETTLSLEYGGKRYEYRITEQDLKRAPLWLPSQENPPLSARRAIESASKQLATMLPSGKDWRVHQVTLKPVESYWYYVVEFLEPVSLVAPGRQVSTGFQVIVLMNGVAVTPKIQ